MSKSIKFSIFLIAVSFLAGAFFYPTMPEMMASHWGVNGQPDDYMPKFGALFAVPFMLLALFSFFLLLPQIDPLKANYSKFKKQYDSFILTMTLFLVYIYALTLMWNKEIEFDMLVAIIPAFAIFFYFLGTLLENSKPNWFVGIRTPWTLSSEKVWDKTNKLGAKIFKVIGVASLAALVLGAQVFFALIGLLVASSIFLVVYSYLEFKKESKAKS